MDGQKLQLQRKIGTAWKTVNGLTLSPSTTTFRFPVKPATTGVYDYRVVAPAYAGHRGSVFAKGLRVRVYKVGIAEVKPRGDEFVTVKNAGKVGVQLKGWKLRSVRARRTVTLPAFTLRPGRVVRIHTGRGRSDADDLYLRKAAMWGAKGTAVLLDSSPRVAAQRRY